MRSFGSKLNVADPIILDCREVGSEQVKILSQVLADSSTQLRHLLETDCRCHILIAQLSRWYHRRPAVKFKELQKKIESDSLDYQEVLLPATTHDLLALLKSLHSGGNVTLLNPNNIDSCWIVLENDLLFEKVNGTLFAPPDDDGFNDVPKAPTNTGVYTSTMLKSLFKMSEIDHIIAYITYSEFCQKIEDPETVRLIESACSSSTKSPMQVECNKTEKLLSVEATRHEIVPFSTDVTKEEYFFFPGLVRCERPGNVWSNDDDENSSHTFSWFMKCNKRQFLNPRFLHVLLLRLTFNFVTPSNSKPLQRKCKIWKNGIHWSTRSGVEVLVEVVEQNTAVVLLLRFIDGHEMKGIELRSKIIEKILLTKEEFCPNSEVIEFVLPQCLSYPTSYPTNFCDVRKVSIGEIAQAMSEGNPCAFDSNDKSHKLKSILHYDSYLPLDRSIIECLWSNDDDQTEVPSEQLSKLTKIQNCEEMGVLGQELVELFEGQEKISYRKLHELLGSFSIFCDRNPLNLASAKGPEMYEESLWQPKLNVNAPSSSVVTQRLQDHNIGAENPLQSLRPHSTVTQDSQITNYVNLPRVTEKIGSGHLVSPSIEITSPELSRAPATTCVPMPHSTSRSPPQVTVEGLQKRFNISDDQLDKMIEQSDVGYLASCFGDVELYLPSLGLKESQNADVRRAVRDHCTEVGMNKALTSWINLCVYYATFRELITITLRTRKAIVWLWIFASI